MDELPEEVIRSAGIRTVAHKPLTLDELGLAVSQLLNG
jgi:hypothetical protein